MKRLITIIVLLSCTCFSFTACKKLIEIKEPKTQISSTTVFSDFETANSAVVGMYSQMMSSEMSLANGGMSIFGGLLADDLISPVMNSDYDPFQHNALTADNSTINYNFWTFAYSNIYQANSIIDGLTNSTAVPEQQKNSLIGEAKVVRSFYYFYLTNLFGPVPLITDKDFRVNALIPRTAIDSVNSFVINDLNDAITFLPATYSSSDRVRPCQYVAAALLSRVQLFSGKWNEAIQLASKVISAPELTLNTSADLITAFLITSPETIWQLPQAYPNDVNSVEGEMFIPSPGSMPQFSLTASLVGSFEPGDQRKINWIDSTEIDGTIYYYPSKYKIQFSSDQQENNILFRLPEIYLIRAEAYLKLNQVEAAIADINKIRERAGLTDLPPGITLPELESSIAAENQHEFFAEFGHRWLDLKRTNTVDAILSAEKSGNWQSTDAYFPVPLKEIETNKNLVQNPGY